MYSSPPKHNTHRTEERDRERAETIRKREGETEEGQREGGTETGLRYK